MDEALVTCSYCGSTEDYEIRPAPNGDLPFCCYKALERVCLKCGKTFRYLVMKKDWGTWAEYPKEVRPGHEVYGTDNNCPTCGAYLYAGSNYCSQCGAKLSRPIGG